MFLTPKDHEVLTDVLEDKIFNVKPYFTLAPVISAGVSLLLAFWMTASGSLIAGLVSMWIAVVLKEIIKNYVPLVLGVLLSKRHFGLAIKLFVSEVLWSTQVNLATMVIALILYSFVPHSFPVNLFLCALLIFGGR